MRRRLENVMVAGFVAGVVVACSGPAMDLAGGLMQDAGEAMQDAGVSMMARADSGAGLMPDAGRVLMDAGSALTDAGTSVRGDAGGPTRDAGSSLVDAGRVMQDAGQVLQDAGGDGSVQAQACGEWCTATGAVRMITADQDSTRYFRHAPAPGDWTLTDGPVTFASDYYVYTIELRDGPLVINTESGPGTRYVVPQGTSCDVTLTATGAATLPTGAILTASVGAMVYSDETLCAYYRGSVAVGLAAPPAPSNVLVRGYRPYE